VKRAPAGSEAARLATLHNARPTADSFTREHKRPVTIPSGCRVPATSLVMAARTAGNGRDSGPSRFAGGLPGLSETGPES
jgi:hypothetical protein